MSEIISDLYAKIDALYTPYFNSCALEDVDDINLDDVQLPENIEIEDEQLNQEVPTPVAGEVLSNPPKEVEVPLDELSDKEFLTKLGKELWKEAILLMGKYVPEEQRSLSELETLELGIECCESAIKELEHSGQPRAATLIRFFNICIKGNTARIEEIQQAEASI